MELYWVLSLCALHLVPSLSKQSLTHTSPRDMDSLVECLPCVSEVLSTIPRLEKTKQAKKKLLTHTKPSLNLKITGAKFSHLYQVYQACDLLRMLFCCAWDKKWVSECVCVWEDIRAAKIPFKCLRNKFNLLMDLRSLETPGLGLIIKVLSDEIKQLSLFIPPSFF